MSLMALFSLERLFLGLKEGSFHYKFGHIERFQFDFIFSYKEDIIFTNANHHNTQNTPLK